MARAFGKVILLGEHAVVYGHPALAAALDRGVTSHGVASERDDAIDELVISPWGVRASADDSPDGEPSLGRAFAQVLATYPRERPRVRVEAEVAIPGGSGLGCSAALGVAVVRAIDEALFETHSLDEDIARSLRWEQVFHGQPSGVDNTIAAAGGLALFVKGEPLVPLRARHVLRLVVGDSGGASATRAMVDRVARRHAKTPDKIEQTFETIATLVRDGKLAIERGDVRGLGQLMTRNHALLTELSLSTPKLEELCAAAHKAGALGAKLTGAGGGGCMIALCADAEAAERVRSAVASVAHNAFVVTIGGREP